MHSMATDTAMINESASSLMPMTVNEMPTSIGLLITTSCQIIFSTVGVLGNFVCFTVLRSQAKENHTNWLIVNQCVADFITSVVQIAGATHLNWFAQPPSHGGIRAQLYCRLWDSRVLLFACFAISTFNLTVISVERYVAVVHPMVYMMRFKRRTVYTLAFIAWLTAPILQGFLAALNFDYVDGSCGYIDTGPAIGVALFFWEYFIPVTIMGYSFARIAWKLHSLNRLSAVVTEASTISQPQQQSVLAVPTSAQASSFAEPSTTNGGAQGSEQVTRGRPTGKNAGNVRRRNITITLLIIYVSYLICWTPNQFVFLVFNFGVIPGYIGSSWHSFTTILATLNICVNPIVYALKYKAFRRGLKDIFKRCRQTEE